MPSTNAHNSHNPVPTPFTKEELDLLLRNIDNYSPEEQEELYKLVDELYKKQRAEACYNDLIAFACAMQPDYKVGKHHRKLADLLMEIERGREYDDEGVPLDDTGKDRVCVNIPPRHGKSQLVSLYFPAWYLGRNPDKKVMMVSHTTDLAVDFGRKVRNLISTEQYQAVFPNVQLAQDSKSAGRWNTNAGGEYYACGIGSSIAGRGAHLLLVDDPHSEQDVLNGNFDVFDKAYEWFTYGARTRLMPGGRVAIVQTRWHLDDLTGRVVRDMAQNQQADQYEVIEFPAILEIEQETEEEGKTVSKIVEKPLWPEFFNLNALHRTKASMPLFQWNAQYQQKPTAEEAALVKREWWTYWDYDTPPECEYIIMSLDAAAEKNNRADYTAITIWGVFNYEGGQRDSDGNTIGVPNTYNLILLNSIKERMEFPELKEKAYNEYLEWEPDAFIVEKKSSGTPLYQELRRTGVMVQEFTPHRGSGDKIARLNSVADIIKSGLVWVPRTRWAEELVEEVAGFPFMSHDDLVDSMVMALMRFRQGGFISLPSDEVEENSLYRRKRGGYY
jgi:predicted phage terminase large subunit-like protein